MISLITYIFGLLIVLVATSPNSKIDPVVLQAAEEKGFADVVIYLKDNNLARIREEVQNLRLSTHFERSKALYKNLKAYADTSQGNILSFLKSRRNSDMRVRQLWISNRIAVRNMDFQTIKGSAELQDVATIREDRKIPIEKVQKSLTTKLISPADNQWNIEQIGAPQVWNKYQNRGEGIVIGSIDTGCMVSHLCLKEKYINQCWYDAYDVYKKPADEHGHGTHTIGTMCGDCGIGVAPAAKFVSCRGCDSSSCTSSALEACGQWMLYPVDINNNALPQCLPNVINNSWGGGPDDPFYWDVVSAWNAAGIFSSFACGNSGPGCNTVGSPGDYNNTICAAATDNSKMVAWFSGRGPGSDPNVMKPDIAAPGVNILSCSIAGNDLGQFMSGTSMASPHIAGSIALMLSAVNQSQPVLSSQCAAKLAYELLEKMSQPSVFEGSSCNSMDTENSPISNPIVGHGICNLNIAMDHYASMDFNAKC